jgi:hypothetical protein
MPRNGSGTYSLVSGNPVSTQTTIQSNWANNTLSDIASALTASIAIDGQTPPTNNLPMGGFKHTGVALGSASTDYARYDQLTALSGVVLNRVYDDYTANADLTAVIPSDNTIPQISEGTQVLSVTITPTAATSVLRASNCSNPTSSI